jgi:hypothetical protein
MDRCHVVLFVYIGVYEGHQLSFLHPPKNLSDIQSFHITGQILLYVLLTFCLLATLADLEPGFSRSATEQTSKCVPIPEFLASNFPIKASFSLFQFFQPNIQKPSPTTILYSPQDHGLLGSSKNSSLLRTWTSMRRLSAGRGSDGRFNSSSLRELVVK